MIKNRAKQWVVYVGILIAILLGIIIWLLIKQDSRPASTVDVPQSTSVGKEYFQEPEIGNGIPSKNLVTNITDISVFWHQQSVVDGYDSCTIYATSSKEILATNDIPGGLTIESNTRQPERKYFSKDYSHNTLDRLMDNYCYK